nr:nucleotidyltransferase domain-containing protein [Aquimarina sp. MMG016]
MLYFSIFKYPLSAKEIYLFSNAATEKEITDELNYLQDKGVVSNSESYYFLDNNIQTVSRRMKGNKYAKSVMNKAVRKGVFISKFPFVKAVGISGALSKNYHDEDSDVDFFIITEPKRLWIARTLLVLYKKVFLFNSRKFFCINYFISEDKLKIKEQNIFTATELLTLIPISGDFDAFYESNQWVSKFLPNLKIGKKPLQGNIKKNWVSNFIRYILNNKIGNSLDHFFLRITLKKWHLKFNHLSETDFKVAMKSTKDVSKHHPQNFQKKVIDRLNQKYQEFQNKYNIELEQEHA